MAEGLTCVGAIAGGFGVHGEVRLKSFCAEPAAIAGYAPARHRGRDGASGCASCDPSRGAFAARLTGVATRRGGGGAQGDAALRAARPAAPARRRRVTTTPTSSASRWSTPDGAPLGTVRAVLDHGAGGHSRDRPAGPGPEILLPFTREAVPTVDLAGRRIVADPPEGLLDRG